MRYGPLAIPVAYSVLRLLDCIPPDDLSPFDGFCCCWIAFNNIYVRIASDAGARAEVIALGGVVQLEHVAHVDVPKMKPAGEKKQILHAVAALEPHVKDALIADDSIAYFVQRHPPLHGFEPPPDPLGQVPNGVLNVAYTEAAGRPVWSAIDPAAYQRFCDGTHSPIDRDALAKQIVLMLYTIRNNTFHGGKEPDDANDERVVARAYPLLRIIVNSFMNA